MKTLGALAMVCCAATAGADVPLGHPDFRPSPQHPVGYRGDWTGRFGGAEPVTAWNIEQGINVLWRLPTKRFGCATPLVVGDKLLVVMEPGWLICLDKMTGRLLWAGEGGGSTVHDAARLSELVNDDRSASTQPAEQVLWSQRRLGYGQFSGRTMPTPVSDGRRVWVKFGHQAACFDLDGRCKWATDTHLQNTDHPQNVASPGLAVCPDGRSVLFCDGGATPHWQENSRNKLPDGALPPNRNAGKVHWMVGLDAASGKIIWDIGPMNAGGYHMGSSPIAVRVGQGSQRRSFIVTGEGQVLRPEDGKLLVPYVGARCGTPTPYAIGDDLLIQHVFSAARIDLSLTPTGDVAARKRWSVPCEKITCGTLYSDGLIYNQSIWAAKGHSWLAVYDAADGRCVFRGQLPVEMPRDVSDYPCPALAGNYVFLLTDQTAIVVEPGRRPKCVASSRFERMHAGATFDGPRMYLRTFDAVVCIARKGEEGARYERQVQASTPRDIPPTTQPAEPRSRPPVRPPAKAAGKSRPKAADGPPTKPGAKPTPATRLRPGADGEDGA